MELRARARENVPALAALLTVVSLGLVFGAALRVIPSSLLPQASEATLSAVPHVNAAVSTVAVVTIVAGVLSARRGDYRRHRALMGTSLVLFAVFLALYLYKVILAGPAPFPGPETVYRFVYLPTLAVHVLLAVVCVPLLYYVALLAATRPVSEVFGTRHRRVGRVAASLWLVSFVLGNAVYAMLYVVPW
jgi:putative membrane protein